MMFAKTLTLETPKCHAYKYRKSPKATADKSKKTNEKDKS